jgi:hypothetical protein
MQHVGVHIQRVASKVVKQQSDVRDGERVFRWKLVKFVDVFPLESGVGGICRRQHFRT